MVSGAIEVAVSEGPGGIETAHVVDVTAARPGGVDIFFADPVAYAAKVVEQVAVLEPQFAFEDEPEPWKAII